MKQQKSRNKILVLEINRIEFWSLEAQERVRSLSPENCGTELAFRLHASWVHSLKEKRMIVGALGFDSSAVGDSCGC